MSRRAAVVLLACIVTLGIALRLHQLTGRTLWFDEAYTWHLSRFPLAELLTRVAQDNSPPLHFVLLHCWMQVFGESVAALRALSVVLGALSIVGTYLFCTELFRERCAEHGHQAAAASVGKGLHAVSRNAIDRSRAARSKHAAGCTSRRDEAAGGRGVGLMAALLMAVNSLQIVYASEARMYALGAALAAWSSWALLAAVHRPRKRAAWWTAYVATAAALPYSHYYGLFTLAAQALYVVVLLVQWRGDPVRQRGLLRRAVFSALAIAACYAPWLPALLEQRAHVKAEYWTGPVGPWTIPNTFLRMVFPTERPVLDYGRSALVMDVFLVACLIVARRCRPQAAFLLPGAALPFAAATAISLLDVSVFSYRYFLFAAVFVLAIVAAAIVELPRRSWRAIAGGTVAVGMLLAHAALLEQWNIPGQRGMQEAVAWVAEHAGSADAVVVGSPLLLFTAHYYLQDGPPCRLLETTPTRHYEGGPGLLPEMVWSTADVAESSHARLWVLDTDGAWWRNRDRPAPVRGPWRLATRQVFPEIFGFQGNVILREFRRDAAGATARHPEGRASPTTPTSSESPGDLSKPVS